MRDIRQVQARIKQLVQHNTRLFERYKTAKQIIRTFRKPAFYEVSQRCNIRCEGCYYFEDANRSNLTQEMDDNAWEDFFYTEGQRGVSMAYLVGAEPALHVERLLAASRNIQYGKIGTNGSIFIDKAVNFRIGISVWGDEEEDAKTRSEKILHKALKNYAGDPRAIMLFTLSPWNLHTIDSVVAMSQDHDIPVTFSMYSPTTSYLQKWRNFVPADNKFFRLAGQRSIPLFSEHELEIAKYGMLKAMDDYPQTVLFSKSYCERITRPGPMYALDDTQIAIDCSSRIREPLRYYRTDGSTAQMKCCTPDVDCANCRLYSGGWSSRFVPDAEYLIDEVSFAAWLDIIETVGKIFLYPNPTAN